MDIFVNKLSFVSKHFYGQKRCLMSGIAFLSGILVVLSSTIGFSGVAQAQAALSPAASNTVDISADHQQYDPSKRLYHLNGKVVVKYKDYLITGIEAKVDMDDSGNASLAHFFHRPTVKHFQPKTALKPAGEDIVFGDTVKIYLKDNMFGAEGNVISYINTVADDPFTVWSDAQLIDNTKKIVTANGNVKVDYNKSIIYGNNAMLRMNEAGKADKVIFTGDAKLLKDTTEITSQRLTIDVPTGNLYAENNVRTHVDLTKKPNGPPEVVVYSDYQNYDKATDKMIASGHVKILYGNYVATGPKATFNLVNGSVDKIFLTGRSTIIETIEGKKRRVTADKIIITTNPKNFDAVGNVQTQFQASPKGGASTPAPAPASKTTKGKVVTPAPKKTVLPAKSGPTVIPDNPLDYQ